MFDRFKFSKDLRIRHQSAFDAVFRSRKRINGRFGALRFYQAKGDHPRLGAIIGKRNVRLAVKRNYIRRIVREQFRHFQHQLSDYDLVFVAFKQANDASPSELQQCVRHLFTTLIKRSARP